MIISCGQLINLRTNIRERLFLSFRERVRGIAIGTAQVARGEPNENARQTRKGALTLQAQIDFIDDQRAGHKAKVSRIRLIGQDFSGTVRVLPAAPARLKPWRRKVLPPFLHTIKFTVRCSKMV